MADTVFRSLRLLCCYTCSQEWFGPAGEVKARQHAVLTGHRVRIELLVRETLNAADAFDEETEESAVEQVRLTPAELNLSRRAAIARLPESERV